MATLKFIKKTSVVIARFSYPKKTLFALLLVIIRSRKNLFTSFFLSEKRRTDTERRSDMKRGETV